MTTSKDTPDPATSASSVLVRMARVNCNRLIVKFDPVEIHRARRWRYVAKARRSV
jgi:hypothetical protein